MNGDREIIFPVQLTTSTHCQSMLLTGLPSRVRVSSLRTKSQTKLSTAALRTFRRFFPAIVTAFRRFFLDSTRPFWRATYYYLGHSSIPRWHASMRAARRQGVLEVVRCRTRPSSRVRARTPPVQHLLCGGYKLSLHAFQDMHHGRFGTSEEEKGGGEKQLSESQPSRHRFGVCFTLTIPGSSRNHPSSRGR